MQKKITLETLATMIAKEFGSVNSLIENLRAEMATKEDLERLRAELMRDMVSKSDLQDTKEEILKAIDREISVIEHDTDSRFKDHERRITSVEKKVGIK